MINILHCWRIWSVINYNVELKTKHCYEFWIVKIHIHAYRWIGNNDNTLLYFTEFYKQFIIYQDVYELWSFGVDWIISE